MAATKRNTTERGLGWRHQQAVAALKRRHQDGSPCDWCGKPMYLDPTRNWDYNAKVAYSGVLQGDHGAMTRAQAIRQGVTIPLPDRLLHRKCNQQRGDGVNDHLAAANRNQPERLAMDWPW
ncbi:hypothetical protein [Mycolicibacterium gilvum]|uniref:hypothetical protein n=1 Tax=Mycolicibacterium gilvum TaxID=1804 RepID=UPI0040465923